MQTVQYGEVPTVSLYIKTPLLEMLDYSGINRSVILKMEAYQPVGSFKLRGIEALCKQAIHGGARHLVSSSGGNAGLATAYVGRKSKATAFFNWIKLIPAQAA